MCSGQPQNWHKQIVLKGFKMTNIISTFNINNFKGAEEVCTNFFTHRILLRLLEIRDVDQRCC